jgi:hypothetical protein
MDSRTFRIVAMTHAHRALLALVLSGSLIIASSLTGSLRASAVDPCSYANVNPIPCENQQPGTDPSIWGVSGAGDTSIQGFTTDISVNVGGTVSFKINTTSTNYSLTIYRLGYYQGNGARQVAVVQPSAALPQNQPACLTAAATGLIDCGNWGVSASWTVPSNAASGVYFARVADNISGAASQIWFVVRNDSSTSSIVFRTNDTTWQAYNDYGGNSLYYGTAPSSNGRAYKVSYNRPFHDRSEGGGYGTSNFVLYGEYPMIRWLEANGYNVSYISEVDAERAPTLLKNHKVVVASGHDEYWSSGQRSALQAARDAGVSLAFFTGNDDFWKVRWENSIDGSGTAYRTLVCYKETLDQKVLDPLDPPTWTGTWRDPTFSPPADGGKPENALGGPIFTVNRGSAAPVIGSAFSRLRFWRNTAIANLASGQTVTLGTQTIGYEWDEDLDNGFRPAGLIDMSSTTLQVPERIQDYGKTYGPGTATHSLTMYRASSGALVFSSGTVQWAWGLDVNHDTNPDTGPSAPDLNMQQATLNLFADMGVAPATPQAGLVVTAGSTDATPPTSTITAPSQNASYVSGTQVTITGTASDAGGGVVASVEVSVDGGATWHKGTGAGSWSFTWTAGAPGSVTIKSRAVDDSGNLETPAAGVAVSVTPRTCPCGLFAAGATPSTPNTADAAAVEVGVKFTVDSPGVISGLRFYKGSSNTGTHTGSLWDSAGNLLATGTFTGESASGWQSLTFASSVAIQANTVYVASYHTGVGYYSSDQGYFLNQVDAWPLHAPAGTNGVYAYGASQFPTQTYGSSNYWVDVSYTPTSSLIPAVTFTSPASNATNASWAAPVSASFNEGVTQSSIQFTLTGPNNASVPGTVSYSSMTNTATFTPNAALAATTQYTATVAGATDSNGHVMSGPYSWSFTTASACPCTLFPSTATPAVPSASDSSSVELGVKFKADVNGYVNGVRFYKGASNTGTHIGNLWSSAGQQLATATFTGESASGWQQVLFATPVAVTAGALYVASYFAPAGQYAATGSGFASGTDSGVLHAPSSGTVSGNGVYVYGAASGFPSQSYNATNYWVDVVFSTSLAPTVTRVTPANQATGVQTGVAPTVTFNEGVTPASIQFTLSGPGSSQVSGTVSYASSTSTATFTPGTALAAATQYTATVSGATDPAGHSMSTPYTWSFTTAAQPVTLFPSTATPATPSVNDPQSIELGMKFISDVSGTVTGVRFYKGPNNTGTHVGTLWNASGQLLATATFSNETATGWQQVTFSQPVAISANTTYVVSYHSSGNYSATSNGFSSAVNNPPLHGVANSVSPNGVYVYSFSTTFPSQSYNATNYWVDVVFVPGS